MNKIQEFPKHLIAKKRIRKCDFCKKDFEWDEAKGSAWFGNYIIFGEGYDAHEIENIEKIVCSDECRNNFEPYL